MARKDRARPLACLRLSMVLVLLALVVSLSYVVYRVLRDEEIDRWEREYKWEATNLLATFARSSQTAILISIKLGNGFGRKLLTLQQFIKLSENMSGTPLAPFRAVSYNPLVKATDRAAFELLATTVNFTNAYAAISEEWSATQLALGIWTRNATGDRVPSPSTMPFHVPVLYIDPLALNFAAILFDIASEPVRKRAIDLAISSGRPVMTDIIELVQDNTRRAASLLIAPVLDDITSEVIGFLVNVINFDSLIEKSLSTRAWSNCVVIKGPASAYTFLVEGRQVVAQRPGDHPVMKQFRNSLTVPVGVDFVFDVYPTENSKDEALTDTPLRAVFIVLAVGLVPLVIFIVYDVISRRKSREADDLIESLLRGRKKPQADWTQERRKLATTLPMPFTITPKEISIRNLTVIEQIAEGHFSTVFKGLLSDPNTGMQQTVAIKILRENDRDAGLQEALIWAQFSHPNIQPMFGVITEIRRLILISPFCENGTLAGLLQRQVASTAYSPTERLEIALQVASGLEYLHAIPLVHGDIAARNVMVTSDYFFRLTDFGLTCQLGRNSVYYSKDNALAPVRWLAPEALTISAFSTRSDVWSFGVLLWEIFSDGSIPYGPVPLQDVAQKLRKHEVLWKPPNCPDVVYRECMLGCWQIIPGKRVGVEKLIHIMQVCHRTLVEVNTEQVDDDVSVHSVLEDLRKVNFAANRKFGRATLESHDNSQSDGSHYRGVQEMKSQPYQALQVSAFPPKCTENFSSVVLPHRVRKTRRQYMDERQRRRLADELLNSHQNRYQVSHYNSERRVTREHEQHDEATVKRIRTRSISLAVPRRLVDMDSLNEKDPQAASLPCTHDLWMQGKGHFSLSTSPLSGPMSSSSDDEEASTVPHLEDASLDPPSLRSAVFLSEV